MSIGKTIKEKRLLLNMRMEDLAKQVGISRSLLWSIEKGDSNYSIKTLLALTKALDLKFDFEENQLKTRNERARRINSKLDKKINRFIVMCVTQYSKKYNSDFVDTYFEFLNKGLINEIESDYEDLHGMSTEYLNDYFFTIINGGEA